jgi:hypothetical protein
MDSLGSATQLADSKGLADSGLATDTAVRKPNEANATGKVAAAGKVGKASQAIGKATSIGGESFDFSTRDRDLKEIRSRIRKARAGRDILHVKTSSGEVLQIDPTEPYSKRGPIEINTRHREIMRRLCIGQRPWQICMEMGISPSNLTVLIRSPLFLTELKHMEAQRDASVADMDRQVHQIIRPEATKKIVELMRSTGASKSLQLQAASKLIEIDRANLTGRGNGNGGGNGNGANLSISGKVVHEHHHTLHNSVQAAWELRRRRLETLGGQVTTQVEGQDDSAVETEFSVVGHNVACPAEAADGARHTPPLTEVVTGQSPLASPQSVEPPPFSPPFSPPPSGLSGTLIDKVLLDLEEMEKSLSAGEELESISVAEELGFSF